MFIFLLPSPSPEWWQHVKIKMKGAEPLMVPLHEGHLSMGQLKSILTHG